MMFSRPVAQDTPQSRTRLTGWAALEEHERKREERTVWDYKEDMDSLLVFAGLYSAVLIGLLVESFQNLQADPQQETVQLLRQISAQTNSYTVTGSHINSTVPPSDPTAVPFEARASDILVNVCWFASLVLSLAAASFAILVKQWLKEYIAIEQTIPEERLRIRHYRKGGLETWKLFEIAAVLPLILQLALTLFFIGLYVFTSSVHASIGTTCICLVGGWAAFFAFALLAPILSPRCPYKTTFLKHVLSTIRIYALSATKYSLAHRASIRVWLCLSTLAASSTLLVVAVLKWLRQCFSVLVASLGLPAVVQWILQVAENTTRLARWTIITSYHAMSQTENSRGTISPVPHPRFKGITLKDEESEICRTNEKDTTIVTGIDAMVNDELLVPMELALRHTRPLLKGVVQFAMNCAERRLTVQNLRDHIRDASLDVLPFLTELLDATRLPVINIVADSLHTAVNQAAREELIAGDSEQAELAWKFLVIFLNKWRQPMPGRVLELTRSLSSRGTFAGLKYYQYRADHHGLAKVVSNIHDVLRSLDANWATSPLNVFFQCYFWKGDPEDTRIPRSLLAVGQLQWSNLRDEVSCGSLIALLELALTVVDAALSQRDTAGEILTLTLGEVELIGFVLDAIPLIFETRPNHKFDQMTVPGAFSNPLLVVRALFLEPGTLPQLLDCILARSDVLSTCKTA